MTVLSTDGLTRRFGALTAVDHLLLRVNAGEVFGLLGPNGAGKTTVIKMLTTLLPPTEGTAEIAGFDIIRRSRDVRRVIGHVPQMVSADGGLTARENLAVFARLYDIPRAERDERVRAALRMMGLEDAAARTVNTFSGGMIRRLELAQSMLHRPRVLFLDEPTVGLDPPARRTVWEHIRRLQGEHGATIFLTTHYLEEAESLCDRLTIMHHGRVVASGSADELKASIGGGEATLDQVFERVAGESIESAESFRETARTRRTARRLG